MSVRIRFCDFCGKDFAWQEPVCPHCQLPVAEPIRHVVAPLEGVTYRNRDGTNRQHILKDLQVRLRRLAGGSILFGEQLVLTFEEPAPGKIRADVCLDRGPQIGSLADPLSAQLATAIENGTEVTCLLLEITPGTTDVPALAARVVVLLTGPDVSVEQAQQYVMDHEAAWRAT